MFLVQTRRAPSAAMLAMPSGALTPEELETLLEDAFVVRDRTEIAGLFETDALLATAGADARGAGIEAFIAALWASELTYLAQPRRVLQAGNTALIVAQQSISVVRRAADARWRYAIALLNPILQRRPSMTDATLSENARWWLDALAVIKTRATDTNGQLTIIEVTEPPNAEAPLHVHHREDEGFYVLDGDVTIHVGDDVVKAGPGDFAFGPRDVPHRYTVGPDGCRMLFICTPGGFEDLVIGMSRPADGLTLPPSSTAEPDWERVGAVAAANGCELLG